MKKRYLYFGGIAIVILIVIFTNFGSSNNFETVNAYEGEMIVYKSVSCGCCGIYSSYFGREGNSAVEVRNVGDMDEIKERFNVPADLETCHTTVVGDYFIEGHVPLEVVEKLLKEKPDLAGIALPGMPQGSPGMPGFKNGDWIIYGVNHDGTYQEYMRY